MRQPTYSHQSRTRFVFEVFQHLIAPALLVGIFLFWASSDARAATETWNPGGAGGGNGTWDAGVTPDWNSGLTWSNSNDALFSGTGGTVTVINPIANSLTFSASGPYLLESGTVTLSGSGVTVNSVATISSAINSSVGLAETGPGALTLTGSTTLSYGNLSIDFGAVNVTNGGSVYEPLPSSAYPSENGNVFVGDSGSGTLQISNGGAVSGYSGYVGYAAGSSGLATVSGSGSSLAFISSLSIGQGGIGTMIISNGGAGSGGALYIGANAGSSGTVLVSGSGSTWASSYIAVGVSGSGTLQITGGGAVSGETGIIGDNAGSSGTVTVSGSGSTWSNSVALYIGDSGTGTLLISGGGNVSGATGGEYYNSFYIGDVAGSSGLVTVTGSSSTLTDGGHLYIGDAGTGTLLITNGGLVSAGQTTVNKASTLLIGLNAIFSSPLIVYGGTLSFADGEVQTFALANSMTVEAGSTFGFDVGNGSDQLTLSGGGSLTLTGASSVNLYGLSGSVTSGTDVLIAAATSGALSLGNVYNSGNFR
jgi:T5SS/PEP-CTERM-associated repeat protein